MFGEQGKERKKRRETGIDKKQRERGETERKQGKKECDKGDNCGNVIFGINLELL